MANTLFPVSDVWIGEANEHKMFPKAFAPFRYFKRVRKEGNGRFFGDWISWFPDKQKLTQFSTTPEEIVDPSIIGTGFTIEIENRLNAIEEQEYRRRVKALPLNELKRQRDLWRELAERSPLLSPNLMLQLVYAPTVILPEEIQERVLQTVLRSQPKGRPSLPEDEQNRLKRFAHGKFKAKLQELLRRDGCKRNETVPSEKVAKWVRQIKEEGYQTNENIIRARLSQMGYSMEKK